jgi:integrase/recombinase XerD
MKIDEVIEHYLTDLSNKSTSEYTLPQYRHGLALLSRLLAEKCQVTELEAVTVLHLRQCAEVLLTTWVTGGPREDRPRSRWGRALEGEGRLAVSSVRYYMRVWKAFFNWCYREELLDRNPVVRLSMPRPEKKVQPVVTLEQMERMLVVCDRSTPLGFRDYVILVVFFDTGMRLSELAGLRVEDVHDTYIKVRGKGRKEREIGIFPEVGKLLWKYIHKYRKPVDEEIKQLFLSRGKPMTTGGVKYVLEHVKQLAGLGDERFSAHAFRRAFAMLYLEQGGDVFKLSREMGHSDVQVTKIYLESFDSQRARKDHNAFSPASLLHLNKRSRRKRKE